MQQLFSMQAPSAISRDIFEDEGNGFQWKHLVYRLCLFHSVVNARKKYGPSAWTASYDFGMADLQVGMYIKLVTHVEAGVGWGR